MPTPALGLPYPTIAATADVPRDIQALAEAVEASLATTVGLIGARPAASKVGRRFFATDVVAEYLDTGSAWLRISLAAGATEWFLRATAPTGWTEASGAAVANSGITVELYAAIGATLPDLRGRTPVGIGTATGAAGATAKALAEKGGEEKHALKATETPVKGHGHGVTDNGHEHAADYTGGQNSDQFAHWTPGDVRTADRGSPGAGAIELPTYRTSATTAGAGSNVAVQNVADGADAPGHNVLSPYQVGMWCVKL